MSSVFPRAQLPPVKAFWSVTMYNAKQSFVDNPINRYAIGDRDKLAVAEDGSVTCTSSTIAGKGQGSQLAPRATRLVQSVSAAVLADAAGPGRHLEAAGRTDYSVNGGSVTQRRDAENAEETQRRQTRILAFLCVFSAFSASLR